MIGSSPYSLTLMQKYRTGSNPVTPTKIFTMEIKGVLKQIHPTVTNGNFESRKIWLTLDPQGQYPQTIELEAQQKNLNVFNSVSIGQWVTCHINLRGREWTNKEGKVVVFNTLSVWKVESAGKMAQPAAAISQQVPSEPQQKTAEMQEVADDLPF